MTEIIEVAAAKEDTPAWLTIGQRLAAILDECNGIQKDAIQKEKDGKRWTEKGHIVEVILSEWRPLLSKYGVGYTPNLVERSYAGNRCDVIVDFAFEVLDIPIIPEGAQLIPGAVSRTIRWAGAGTDNGDKAFAKAGTNALKEMIKKVFLVTDRDDAKEETETIEHESEGVNRRDVDKAKEERRAAIESWAKSFKSAVTNSPNAKDLVRLQRENNDQLMSDDLPEVTRLFFIELLASRKKELEAS